MLKSLLHAMKFHHSLSELDDDGKGNDDASASSVGSSGSTAVDKWDLTQSVVMSKLRSSHQWTHAQFPTFIAKLDSLVLSLFLFLFPILRFVYYYMCDI